MTNDIPSPESRTAVDISLMLVRVIVGVILAAHGSQKVFGWFGGKGLEGTVEQMSGLGVGRMVTYLVAVGECFGGLGLILGFLSRFSAAANIVIMAGAIQMVHGKNGFFAPAGFEYNLALIGLCLPILILGPGRWSLAHCIMPKSASTGRPITVIE
jgi:putative oxidoreductase